MASHTASHHVRRVRFVLHASLVAMIPHAWQVQQQSEARHAFYQGADRGTAKAQDQVPFPVARHGAINRRRRTLADHDLGCSSRHVRGHALAVSATPARYASRPSALGAMRTTLNEQRLIDGFVADAHGLIVREVDRQAASNLLRAPGVCPPPMLPRPMPAAVPAHSGARNRSPTRSDNDPCQSFLHMVRNAG